jgi:hypothetical protein
MKNIHVLPTKNPGKEYVLGKCIKELSDVKIGELVRTFYMMLDEEYFEPQHIYITSDEEIDREPGAHWCIDSHNNKLVLCQKGLPAYHYKYYKKIIMSTDQSISVLCGCGKNCGAKESGIQDIDNEFLEWFVKNSDYEFVNVVYGLYNPMGRLVDLEKVSENHSQCTWKYKIIIPKEDLGYTTKMGVEVNDEMVRKTMIPKEYFGKQETIEEIMFHEERKKFFYEEIINGEKVTVWLNDDYIPKKETLEEAAERLYPDGCDGTNRSAVIYRRIFIEGANCQAKRMYSEEDIMKAFEAGESFGGLPLSSTTTSNKLSKKEWFQQFKKE